MKVHERSVGDTLRTLPVEIQRDGVAISIGSSDVVKFEMVSACGTVKIAETETGIQYTDRAAGQIDFAFSASQVDEEGEFYGYFYHYVGAQKERAPVERQKLKIVIYGK